MFLSIFLIFFIRCLVVDGFESFFYHHIRSTTYRSDLNEPNFAIERKQIETKDETGSLLSTVNECISNITKGPFITSYYNNGISLIIDENITYTTDLIRCMGRVEYEDTVKQWNQEAMNELHYSTFSINRITSLQPNVITIQWNVTFIPDALIAIVWWSKLLRLNITYFNVLDKERVRSTFSWKSFQTFLLTVINTGVVKLPHAVILGMHYNFPLIYSYFPLNLVLNCVYVYR